MAKTTTVSDPKTRLDFGEKLIQPGKRDTTDALLKRIKTLHQTLCEMDQEGFETKSLAGILRPLLDPIILHHKDRGVKAYAACCIADVLRLTAPNSPYTAHEERDIFQFFTALLLDNLRPPLSATRPLQPSRSKSNEQSQSQPQTLAAGSQRVTDIPYYAQYCFLLESLATIKSVVIACDATGGDDNVTGIFQAFVKIVRSDMSKNVIRHLTTILVELIDYLGSPPSGVLDCVIEQFTTYANKPETPSFQLIVDVCNRTAEHFQRSIYSHFSEIQIAHGRDPDKQDLEAMVASHNLILDIWRYTPNMLLLVVPQLEENLRAADEVELRNLTTRTLGRMFGLRPRVGAVVAELAKAYPSTWRAWLGRRVDKSPMVRLTWAETSYGILANIPDLRKDVEAELVDRIQDSNEHVRAAICKVFGELDYETTLHQINPDTLKAIGGRMNDKKAIVRQEASNALSKLWSAAYSEIETNEVEAVEHFAWIPEAILRCLQTKDLPAEYRTSITSTLKNKILPLPLNVEDDEAWVEKLLLVASDLDDAAFIGLERATGLVGYAKGSSPYRAFITFCEENNGGIIDGDEKMVKARLNFVINAIATLHFADADKAKKDMEAFAAANETRLYKLFKSCANPETDLRTLIKSKNELLRRIEQSHSELLDTFTILIENASFNIVNTSSISPLLKILQTPSGPRKEAYAHSAARLLSLIAKECPPMFASHVPELVVVLGNQKNEKLVEVALHALASVCKFEPALAPTDKKHIERVVKLGLSGTPRQAKFAARFLAYSGNEHAPSRLVQGTLDALEEKDEKHLLANLRALAELALSCPAALEEKAEEVHRFIMAEVINKSSSAGEDDTEDEWIDEDKLGILDRAKLTALRVLTHRALGFARAENALTIAEPVMTLLGDVLRQDGSIGPNTNEGGRAKTQLRLRAALCLLKLAQVKSFDKAITPFFEPISYIMQDPVYQVRNRLVLKLGEILPTQRMLPRWNIMPAMIATDPEKDNPALAKSIILSCVRACSNLRPEERIDRVEVPLARLILVLAHHPDLNEWSMGILKDMAKYIELYLDCVAHRDNVGLLFHIAAKLKTVKGVGGDGVPDEDNTNLYKLAEMTQILIRNRSEAQHWTLTVYPGKVKFPRDIFHNLPNQEAAWESSRKENLTAEEAEWAKSIGRRINASAGPSRRLVEAMRSPKRKARPLGTRRKKRARSDETSESESESDDEAGEEEDEFMETEGEEEEEGESEQVVGRGGRREAKTKANKGLKGKKKTKKRAVEGEGDGD